MSSDFKWVAYFRRAVLDIYLTTEEIDADQLAYAAVERDDIGFLRAKQFKITTEPPQLDVTFSEDESRIRSLHSPQNNAKATSHCPQCLRARIIFSPQYSPKVTASGYE
jgi:hypothetical protein